MIVDFAASQDLDSKLQQLPGTNGAVHILIAVEYPIVYEGLASLFKKHADLGIVTWDGSDGRSSGAHNGHPDVIVVDVDSSTSPWHLTEKFPEAKVVALTTSQSEAQIHQAFQLGAKGYLLKSSGLQQIVDCLRVVARGKSWIPPEIAEILSRRMATRALTPRERDVLKIMAQGKSNRQIGDMLNLSEGTVKVHVGHILEKLKAKSRTEALAAAASRGLVSLTARPVPVSEIAVSSMLLPEQSK
jgi:DNA-binding NarL/FixJ family response regulator